MVAFIASWLTIAAFGLLVWLVYTVRAARQDALSALKGIRDLAEAFRRARPS